MKSVLTIASLELRVGIRNRWVLLATLTLLSFAVILVLLGGAPSAGVDANSTDLLVASLATLSVYLLPLIALLLSFDSIAGEVDRGTLQLLLATPVSREAILLGKFLGHVGVLSIAVVAGYGLAGLLAVFAVDGDSEVSVASVYALLRLILSSIVMGASFVAVGLLVSALARQTATAAALAILTWLLSAVLYDLALLGWLVLEPEGLFARKLMPYFLLLNPADAFRVFNMSLLDLGTAGSGLATAAGLLPFSPGVALASPVFATLFFLLLCAARFRRINP